MKRQTPSEVRSTLPPRVTAPASWQTLQPTGKSLTTSTRVPCLNPQAVPGARNAQMHGSRRAYVTPAYADPMRRTAITMGPSLDRHATLRL